jgi:probable phosphoglycerate mutase
VSAGLQQLPFAVPAGATEILFVRHGATEPRFPGRPFALIDGQGDPALGPEGRLQAEAIAERLAAAPAAALFVSTMRRTAETAAPLAARLGLEPIALAELREVHLGEWEGGEYRVRLAARDPLFAQVLREERWDVIPGAEPAAAFAARVAAGLARIVAISGPDALAIAVVHSAVIGELCRQVTGSRPFAFVRNDNGSISRVIVCADGRQLLGSFNDTAHLRPGAR